MWRTTAPPVVGWRRGHDGAERDPPGQFAPRLTRGDARAKSTRCPCTTIASSTALERERLWPHVWQMACREAELAAPGDFVVYDILDDSILIVRTGTGADDVAAMYNVCQHRGRRLRDEPRGRIGKAIHCRFHGWQYAPTGELVHVHFEDDWRGCPSFDKSKLGLPRVKVARWGGWIWINQDPNAEPLAQWLGEVPRFLDPFAPDAMRPLWWKTIIAPANWKILVEAFIEAYHSGATHLSGINYRSARVPGLVLGNHSMLYGEPGPFTEYKSRGRALGHTALAAGEPLGELHASRPDARRDDAGSRHGGVRERLRALPEDTPVDEVLTKLLEYHREEMATRGIAWPEGLTFGGVGGGRSRLARLPEQHRAADLRRRALVSHAAERGAKPGTRDHDTSIVDIWSLGRFAPGEEPAVQQGGLPRLRGVPRPVRVSRRGFLQHRRGEPRREVARLP